VSFLIMPLNFVPEVTQTKRLEYGKITIAELFSIVLSGAVTIALATMGYGVWCLVWQAISKTASRAAALIVLTRWRPRLRFSWERIKRLFGMGVDFTLSNLMMFATDNTDYLLVGKMLGEAPLGVYTMAFRVSKYPVLKIEGIFGRMLFPAFSTFNDDPDRVRKNFLRLMTFFLQWVTPVLVLGIFVADPLIRIVLSDKWEATIPLVQVFMLYLIVSTFCVQNLPVMTAINRLKTWNAVQLGSTALLAAAGWAGIHFLGIMGMAIAFTAVTILSLIVITVILIRMIAIPFAEVFRAVRLHLVKLVAVAGILGGLCWAVWAWTGSAWLRLLIPTAIFGAWMLVVNRSGIRSVLARLRGMRAGAGESVK
jgi:O-antigen/teichoic acid export membrane protein